MLNDNMLDDNLFHLVSAVTSAKIRSLMTNRDKATPTKESHDSHMTKVEEDQDEGEILSDEEEMDSKSQGGPPYAM